MTFDLGTYYYDDQSQQDDNDKEELLAWSSEKPRDDFCDWVLIISTKPDSTDDKSVPRITTCYYVHKCAMAVGKRRSDYLKSIFLENNGNDANTMELPYSAAMAFPAMLNFIYSKTGALEATSENAMALRHLANYFGVKDLFTTINRFIQNDLTFANAPTYLFTAAQYNDRIVMDIALRLCIDNFHKIDISVMQILPPYLLIEILASPSLKCKNKNLCHQITEYCSSKLHILDAQTLTCLFPFEKVPVIHSNDSLFVLYMVEKYDLPKSHHRESLYERSMHAASINWRNILLKNIHYHNDEDALKDVYKQDESLYHSQQHYYNELCLTTKVRLLESALYHADVYITKQTQTHKQQIANLEKQSSVRAEQLESQNKKFKRVPAHHDFQIPKYNERQFEKCTYARKGPGSYHFTKPPPPYLYGKNPPTILPPTVDKKRYEDGWILEEVVNNEKFYWPVFYYRDI